MAALPLSGPAERARAVRTWLRWAETGEALGVFPEGLDGRSDGLRAPEAGFEALAHLLGRRKITFLPCAIFERSRPPSSEGMVHILHVRFGQPLFYGPEMQADPSNRIMEAIASLLPLDLRGPYSGVEAPAVGRESADSLPAGG
jgi:hypothetical protein